MQGSGTRGRAGDWILPEGLCGLVCVRVAGPSVGVGVKMCMSERASCWQVRHTAHVLSSLDAASVGLTLADRLEAPSL